MTKNNEITEEMFFNSDLKDNRVGSPDDVR